MGYACPVCGAEQLDGVHLANHLAVTASIGREDHTGWLEAHAPDWADCGPEELAAQVIEHAGEIETPEYETSEFEGTAHVREPDAELATRPECSGEVDTDHFSGHGHPGVNRVADEPDVRSVLERARKLTEQGWDSVEGTEQSDERPEQSNDGEEQTEETDDSASNDITEE